MAWSWLQIIKSVQKTIMLIQWWSGKVLKKAVWWIRKTLQLENVTIRKKERKSQLLEKDHFTHLKDLDFACKKFQNLDTKNNSENAPKKWSNVVNIYASRKMNSVQLVKWISSIQKIVTRLMSGKWRNLEMHFYISDQMD